MKVVGRYSITYPLVLLFLLSATFNVSASIDDSSLNKTPEQLLILAEQLRFTDVDGANSTLMDAYNIASREQDYPTVTQILLLQTKIAIAQKDYYLAQQYLHRAEGLQSKYDNVTDKVYVLSWMADVKRYLKKFDESQKYIDDATLIAQESKQNELIFIALEIKGALAKSRNRFKEALKIFIQAERHAEGITDQELMSLYRNLAAMYSKIDAQESTARYYAKGINLLEKMGNVRDLPENILDLAVTYRKMSQYDKAIENANKALTIARHNQDEINELRGLVVLSIIYRRLSSYEEALMYATEAYTLYEKNSNYNGLASAANSIALIYKRLGQNENAKNYFERVIKLPEDSIQLKYRASALRELGYIAFVEGEHTEAIKNYQLSYNFFSKIGDNNGVATVNKNFGKMYQSRGEVEKSFAAYNSAKEIFINTGDVWNEAVINSYLAKLLAKVEPLKAIEYAESSIGVAEKIKAKSIYKDAYSAIIDAKEALKDYKSALHYARLKEKIMAEIKQDSMNKRVAEIYIVLDMEKKEKELQNFKRQQAITSLELNRKQAALDILNKEKEISELENKNTLFTVAITFTLLMLAYILYRRKNVF